MKVIWRTFFAGLTFCQMCEIIFIKMISNITIQTQQQGRRVPGIAPGEMYKRYTFGSRPFHSGVVSGFCEDILK